MTQEDLGGNPMGDEFREFKRNLRWADLHGAEESEKHTSV